MQISIHINILKVVLHYFYNQSNILLLNLYNIDGCTMCLENKKFQIFHTNQMEQKRFFMIKLFNIHQKIKKNNVTVCGF